MQMSATGHATRHPSRLDADLGRKTWSDDGCAMETLVAELGAVFVLAGLDFAKISRSDHASYVSSWLKGLKADKRAISSAPAMRSGRGCVHQVLQIGRPWCRSCRLWSSRFALSEALLFETLLSEASMLR